MEGRQETASMRKRSGEDADIFSLYLHGFGVIESGVRLHRDSLKPAKTRSSPYVINLSYRTCVNPDNEI